MAPHTPATTVAGHITVIDGVPTTTTQDIAEVYGKQHAKVLAIVRQRMAEVPEKWRLANFGETVVERPNPSGGAPIQSPVIRMTKKGFHFVVGKFTGAKAVAHQIAYADEFERMEAQLRNASTTGPAIGHTPAAAGAALPPRDQLLCALGLASTVASHVQQHLFDHLTQSTAPADLPHTRWLVWLDHKNTPQVKALAPQAHVGTLPELARRIHSNGLSFTAHDIAALTSACAIHLGYLAHLATHNPTSNPTSKAVQS